MVLQELIVLRAIRDANVPKFLQEDLKLFNGIVSDLFPKIKEASHTHNNNNNNNNDRQCNNRFDGVYDLIKTFAKTVCQLSFTFGCFTYIVCTVFFCYCTTSS